MAASPPMMLNPKSYAAVSKALVVSAAPPQPAAVPKPKLSTAPSMMSTDLKPSVASKLAVNTTSLKVKLPCVQLLVIDRWIGISRCVYILSVLDAGGEGASRAAHRGQRPAD